MPSLLGPFVRCGFGATLLVLCLVLAGFTCTGEFFEQASCLWTKQLINVYVCGGRKVRTKKATSEKLFASCWFFFSFNLTDVSPRLTEHVVGSYCSSSELMRLQGYIHARLSLSVCSSPLTCPPRLKLEGREMSANHRPAVFWCPLVC